VTGIRELLTGYVDPVQKKISESPIGKTGLTVRISNVAILWEVSAILRRQQLWQFGRSKFPDTFGVYLSSIDMAWLTEVCRIMDKPESFGRKNLTVAPCHERFRDESKVTDAQKREEERLYAVLVRTYKAADLLKSRNRATFHLDLEEVQRSPQNTGDVRQITRHLVEWFGYVGTVVFGEEPKFVTLAHLTGQRIAREFRHLLQAGFREETGRPSKRHLRRLSTHVHTDGDGL